MQEYCTDPNVGKCKVFEEGQEFIVDKSVWVEDECTMCLGCLHNCPKFAYFVERHRVNDIIVEKDISSLMVVTDRDEASSGRLQRSKTVYA